MTAVEQAREWVRAGRGDLPLPGGGRTRERWSALTALCARDVSAGRLVEAHADAAAILAEIEGTAVDREQLWGVWAAEPPRPVLEARPDGAGWVLDGVKAWCSGASACTHALVTARAGDAPRLFAVDLAHPGVTPGRGGWAHAGMAGTDTEDVTFRAVPARTVGGPTAYLDRPGFWHGGIGVAACWLGAGVAVAKPLVGRVARGSADAHTAAHLGAVDVALQGAEWALDGAAAAVDAAPDDADAARHRAQLVRSLVEQAVAETLTRTGRALGAGPPARDPAYARAAADAEIYIRQSHAERDLQAVGEQTPGHAGWRP